MDTLRIPLLVLIWRTLIVFAESCTPEKIDYFLTPQPVYQIKRSVEVRVYSCESLGPPIHTNMSMIFDDNKNPINELVSTCLTPRKFSNDNATQVTVRCANISLPKTVAYHCHADNKLDRIRLFDLKLSEIPINITTNLDQITIYGWICRYRLGKCTLIDKSGHDRIFVWKVFYPKHNPCDLNSIYRINYQWVGNLESRYSYRIALRDVNNSKMYGLDLLKSEHAPCGTMWQSELRSIVVFNTVVDTDSIKFNKNVVLRRLKALCSSENRTRDSKGDLKPDVAYDKISLPYLVILFYIVGKIFEVVLNYFALRKLYLKKKRSSKMCLIYCLTQSSTNRCMYFCQEICDKPTFTIITPHGIIRNTPGNEQTNTYDYIKGFGESSSSEEYLTHSKPNNRKPMNEIYSYAAYD